MQKFKTRKDFAKLHTIEQLEKTLKAARVDMEKKIGSE